MKCSQASSFCDKNWMELHSRSAGICWWKLLWPPDIIQRACMGHSRQTGSSKSILCTGTMVSHYCPLQVLYLPLLKGTPFFLPFPWTESCLLTLFKAHSTKFHLLGLLMVSLDKWTPFLGQILSLSWITVVYTSLRLSWRWFVNGMPFSAFLQCV